MFRRIQQKIVQEGIAAYGLGLRIALESARRYLGAL